MTHRPKYMLHPAYAEWQRLSKAGDLAAAASKLCEAMGVTQSRRIESVADIFDAPVANRWPVADVDVRRRSRGDLDPGSPFYQP